MPPPPADRTREAVRFIHIPPPSPEGVTEETPHDGGEDHRLDQLISPDQLTGSDHC